MASTLTTLSIAAYALAAVFFVAAVVFFIVFKIPKVIDYFTNRSAKKNVRKMTNTGASSKINTLQINSKPLANASQTHSGETTAELQHAGTGQQGSTAKDGQETAVLEANTAPEGFAPTEPMAPAEPETALLDNRETDLLPGQPRQSTKPKMEMKKLDELVLTHTQELIP